MEFDPRNGPVFTNDASDADIMDDIALDAALTTPQSEAANPDAVVNTLDLPPLEDAFDPAMGPIFTNDDGLSDDEDDACYQAMLEGREGAFSVKK